jgi:hypothetical protein
MTDIPLTQAKTPWPNLIMTLFLRLVALGCLFMAFKLWASLIGYLDGGVGRFDLLSADIKAADASLAVLYPVAAIGLWLRGAWGPVIWTAASALQVAMHQGFPQIFGQDHLKMLSIGVTALVYLVLRLVVIFSHNAKTKRAN